MKKTKKKKDDREKISFRRMLSNCAFVLRLIQKTAPSYLAVYFLWSVVGALLNFFSSAYLLRRIVNDVELGRSLKGTLILLAVVAAGQLLFTVAINFLSRLLFPRYNQRIVARIETMLFEKSGQVELACYEDPAFYDKYVRAMENAYGKSMEVVYTIDGLIWSTVSLFSNSLLLFFIDPLLMAFGLLPLFLGLVRKKQNKVYHDFDVARNPVERKINYVQRCFYLSEYAKEMRLGNIYKKLFADQKEAFLSYKRLFRKYGPVKGALRFFLNVAMDALMVPGVMLYAAYRAVVSKTLLLGDCVVIFNSIAGISWTLSSLVSRFTDLHKSAVYIEDFRYFLDYEPKISDREESRSPQAGEIAFQDVSFRYLGAQSDSLKHISFTLAPGEKIALVGKNGSGKSTLVKLLLRFYEPTAGKITQAGEDIRSLTLAEYRAQFGVVFQDYKIFSLSVAENILMRPLEEGDEERVVDALQKSGGYEKVAALPKGIHTTLTREFDDEGANLSGGEAQKIAIARVFAKNASFMILDEPSSALDPIAEYRLFENILEAGQGRGMIFISHRLSSAVLADRVLYMEQGEIVECGSHAELMAKGGRYASLFRKQAENYRESDGKAEQKWEDGLFDTGQKSAKESSGTVTPGVRTAGVGTSDGEIAGAWIGSGEKDGMEAAGKDGGWEENLREEAGKEGAGAGRSEKADADAVCMGGGLV